MWLFLSQSEVYHPLLTFQKCASMSLNTALFLPITTAFFFFIIMHEQFFFKLLLIEYCNQPFLM